MLYMKVKSESEKLHTSQWMAIFRSAVGHSYTERKYKAWAVDIVALKENLRQYLSDCLYEKVARPRSRSWTTDLLGF